MSIGMKRGTVYPEPHRTEWEITAEETIRTLKSILGDIAADIQHIGSTSVRTIRAKTAFTFVQGLGVTSAVTR